MRTFVVPRKKEKKDFCGDAGLFKKRDRYEFATKTGKRSSHLWIWEERPKALPFETKDTTNVEPRGKRFH